MTKRHAGWYVNREPLLLYELMNESGVFLFSFLIIQNH